MPLNFQQSFVKKPLVSYHTRERASINLLPTKSNLSVASAADNFESSESMPRKRRGGRTTRSRSKAVRRTKKRRARTSNKIRVVAGRVKLRVTGYQGLQSLAPSSLIRFIPTTKLRLAARRVLRSTGQQPIRRRKRGGKKKTVGRKRR